MSMHSPMFLANKDRKTSGEFKKTAKADILAVIELLYSRGMWSKFHYDKWKKEAQQCDDEIMLHEWWDAIVAGAMYEDDSEEVRELRDGLASKLMES